MIETYLKSRKCRIVFDQSDHNACPNCKTLKYSVLQFHYEAKELKLAFHERFSKEPRPFLSDMQIEADGFWKKVNTKEYQ